MYVLIKFQADYADEHYIYGLKLLTLKEWETKLQELQDFYELSERGGTFYFGTNQEIEFSTLEELNSTLRVCLLSSLEYDVISENVGLGWGLQLNLASNETEDEWFL